ncbi:MAG: hypothetical protein HON42_05130 [Alphaproteobacteria bacterium]|jgi:hypothetical protein|nr:hypothetical protein [Alphaproteobacteria bacterium]
MFLQRIRVILFLLTLTSAVFADRPDAHAPITVMGDHTHKNNEWMISYRLMEMNMADLYDGDSKISHNDISDYMMAPIEMKMKKHMFGAMYGLNDKHTLMFMMPYLENNMTMINLMNKSKSKMKNEGFADLKVADLIDLSYKNWQNSLELGFSLATASVKESYNGVRLPYRMQLGSGTNDLAIGFTGTRYFSKNSIGYQIKSLIRLGQNNQGYSLGNQLTLGSWHAYNFTNTLSSSFNVTYLDEGNIDGKDNAIESAMMSSPTRESGLAGRKLISAAIGLNYVFKREKLHNSRLALEYKFPLYQKLNGPQLGTENIITIGVQQSF